MNWKCPNCGYQTPDPPEPPPIPYQYTGYMKDYLPTILKLLRMGQSPGDAAHTLRQLHRRHFSTGMISYIRKRYGIKSKSASDNRDRDLEIVRRYNSETISMRKLGGEFGISAERVRGILYKAERKAMELRRQNEAYQLAENLKDIPLDSLELPVRILNCFKNEQCVTVGDAMKLSEADLLRVPNFGRTSLNDWKFHLETLMREFEQRKQPTEAHP